MTVHEFATTSLSHLTSLSSDECNVSVDSRTTQPGDIFIALQGKRANGHDFIMQAIERGARALIIDESRKDVLSGLADHHKKQLLVVAVHDTLQALIQLAINWRSRFTYEVIGITGSVGKTTTKELMGSIFAAAGLNGLVSYKNENTDIGLCLNILKMRKSHNVAVFELGINDTGQMALLSNILRPTKALITSVAHAHTQGLQDISTITTEKKKIFSHFQPGNIGFVNGDDAQLGNSFYPHPVVRFGTKVKNHVQARGIKTYQAADRTMVTQFELKLYEHTRRIRLRTPHHGRIYNALAAAALAYHLNIPIDAIVAGLESFSSVEGRFEQLPLAHGRGTLINDCFNANPASMRAALSALHLMKCRGPKIAVLGDMLELGKKGAFWHRQTGRTLGRTMSIDHVILVGPLSKYVIQSAPITMKLTHVADWREANKVLHQLIDQTSDALVLLKGSNGMNLQQMVPEFVASNSCAAGTEKATF